ncbi:MAG: SPASM domain-containing protein [Flavobacteriales bacterium]|nr:SPASM domain-containing protein [Flavobacteriales bacterium]
MKSTIWHDRINLIKRFTPLRIANASRILWSYYKSRITGNPNIQGLPISIAFEPTTSCNLRCPECPSGLRSFTRPTGMLQKHTYLQWLNELEKSLCYVTFYFQGEPFLNKHLPDMILEAHQRNIYTVTSTNAHYLTPEMCKKIIESGLDKLIISIDGTTQEVYESYRIGGTLTKVLDGTKNMVNAKKQRKSRTPHLVFQFLIVRSNEHQIDEVKRIAQSLGVDEVTFKTAQVYNYEHGNDLIPLQPKYSRYKRLSNGTYQLKNKLLNHCWKMWHSCIITWDGKVVPCCFDKDAKYMLGDLSKESFQTIWFSESYRQFRHNLLRSRKEIDICTNCTEGTKVWT